MYPSYAQFAVPDSIVDDLAYQISITFLVRTSQPSGLIFFVGTDTSVAASNETFLTIELSPIGVVSKIKLGDEIQTNALPCFVTDGEQHFVHVSRNYSLLQMQLDDISMFYAINYSLPLVADVFYVGGMPHKRRRRRDANSANTDQFSGTLQDFRVNGKRLQPFPLNSTDEDGTPPPSVELPKETVGIEVGEQSDDVCLLLQPCENNATCHTQFYNEYR